MDVEIGGTSARAPISTGRVNIDIVCRERACPASMLGLPEISASPGHRGYLPLVVKVVLAAPETGMLETV